MFYKILDNNDNVITVSNEASFYKYFDSSNKLISVNSDIADRVRVNKKLYKIQGSNTPGDPLFYIDIISEEEYNELEAKIEEKPPVVSLYLKRTREEKIAELCSICQQKIIEGCNIVLSIGTQHFKFNNEDQMNITRLMNNLQLSRNTKVLYHSSGNKVEYYSAADFTKIYNEMNKHITYHTTYFNLLKNCINNMYNPLEIKKISYGYKLTNSEDIQLLKQIRR